MVGGDLADDAVGQAGGGPAELRGLHRDAAATAAATAGTGFLAGAPGDGGGEEGGGQRHGGHAGTERGVLHGGQLSQNVGPARPRRRWARDEAQALEILRLVMRSG